MTCHGFTHEILDRNRYLPHNVSPVCPTESHSSGLTNAENKTSNFRQSVQICCREEQREENNATRSLNCNYEKFYIDIFQVCADLATLV